MEEREFTSCYQKLIAHYRQTPEESKRQFAGILRRIGTAGCENHNPEETKRER